MRRGQRKRQARENKMIFVMKKREESATVNTLLQQQLKMMTDMEWLAKEMLNVMVERAWFTLLQHQALDSHMWREMNVLDRKQEGEDRAMNKSD